MVEYLKSWLRDGVFPEKNFWKRIVRNTIENEFRNSRIDSMVHDPDFKDFCSIFEFHDPTVLWSISLHSHDTLLCKFIAKICSFVSNEIPEVCRLCTLSYTNIYRHVTCTCASTFLYREKWWDFITENFDLSVCAELCSLDELSLYYTLLGRRINLSLSENELLRFNYGNFKFVRAVCSYYNMQLRHSS